MSRDDAVPERALSDVSVRPSTEPFDGPTDAPSDAPFEERRAELRAGFVERHPFRLDVFQRRAMDCLDRGHGVLVAAPTGSGKTIVAEYGIAGALADGKRAFYTAPIKALSNQKYRELVAIYGAEGVGLLTGDNAINGEAPVVVMTTEVLRNMIYARSRALSSLGVVVLDEVHFIQDTYRGPVWEEVIIHLPAHVRLVCLSATVSNANELADWITTVRGPTEPVVEQTRPVRLDQLYFVGDRTSDKLHVFPTLVDGRPNPEAARLDAEAARGTRKGDPRKGGSKQQSRRTLFMPSRGDVVDRLAERDMLPAIYFIFSRSQCDDAARSVGRAGVRLTSVGEQHRIRAIAEARLSGFDSADLEVLGHGAFLTQLEAGIAAHHAGMVPPFKEVVEACFAEGLVKVVFATETLAVGINMPARTVVIEKLSKFSGERHTFLTPGEYTQLTGRAGRRGIDEVGQAVVLWSPFVPFDQVAALALSRSFHLHSAFRPTYNMAANLIGRYTRAEANRLLNLSFAQYQADRDLVKIEVRLQRREFQLAELRESAVSPFGDIEDYRAAQSRRLTERDVASVVEAGLDALRPGDVIHISHGAYTGRAAVSTIAQRKGTTRIQVITTQRASVTLTAEDFDAAPEVLGHVEVPIPYAPHRTAFVKDLARGLDRAQLAPQRGQSRSGRQRDDLVHPVSRDPDLRRRLERAGQADRIAREVAQLRGKVDDRDRSVARDFDRVLAMLSKRGYTEGWTLTPAGHLLAGLFHECDLLVAEVLRAGLLDGLDPAALAGMVSVFVYEHRSSEPAPAPWFPSKAFRDRWRSVEALSDDLRRAEERAGLLPHRMPDPTYVAVAYAWAAGESFAEVVAAEDLSGGDFVRTMRQLIDLLRQLVIVAPASTTRQAADRAAEMLHRGVVAASLPVPEPAPDPTPEPAREHARLRDMT